MRVLIGVTWGAFLLGVFMLSQWLVGRGEDAAERTGYSRGYAAAVDSVRAHGFRVVGADDTLALAWDRDSLPVLLWIPKQAVR